MINRKYIAIALIPLFVSSLFSLIIPTCDANYTNWRNFEEGSAFHNGTYISMPYADVQINITRRATEVYVSLDSEFHIMSNVTQNATLAFVYTANNDGNTILHSPPVTGDFYPYNESNFLHIYNNGSLVNHTIMDYDEFATSGFTLEDIIQYTEIYPFVSFALVDIELIANTTHVLRTQTGTVFYYTMDRFDYYYVVGSARTFDGNTIERVQMHVVEEIPFLSSSFYPDEALTITEDGIATDAIWNLNLSEFSRDVVHFTAQVWDPNRDWDNILYQTSAIVAIMLFVFYFGVWRPRKHVS